MTKRIAVLASLALLAATLAFAQGGINTTSLTAAADNKQTYLYVASGSGITAGMTGYLESEAFRAIAVVPPGTSAATLRVMRGVNGTAAVPHLKGTPVLIGTATDWGNLGARPDRNSAVSATVASGDTISAPGLLFHVSGTTTINTINLPPRFFGGCITLIPDDTWSTGTTGNIKIATTGVQYKALRECYDAATATWYPSY